MKKFVTTCGKTLDEPGLIDRLREEHFDVYIAQNFDYCGISANFHSFNRMLTNCFVGLAHLIKPKAIVSASPSTLNGYLFEDWGVPEALSYRPGKHVHLCEYFLAKIPFILRTQDFISTKRPRSDNHKYCNDCILIRCFFFSPLHVLTQRPFPNRSCMEYLRELRPSWSHLRPSTGYEFLL